MNNSLLNIYRIASFIMLIGIAYSLYSENVFYLMPLILFHLMIQTRIFSDKKFGQTQSTIYLLLFIICSIISMMTF